MISMTVVPVSPDISAHGRCWMCRQLFVDDEFYCRLALPCGETITTWLTCLGCSAQLACRPMRSPGDNPDAG